MSMKEFLAKYTFRQKLIAVFTAFSLLFLCNFVKSYNLFLRQEQASLKAQTYKIAFDFVSMFNEAEFLLNQIAKEISKSDGEDKEVANILLLLNDSYDGTLIKGELSTGKFYWIDNKNLLVATSDGLIPNPIDLNDRVYLQKTSREFNKIYNGDPIVGALSHRYILPVGVGVGDKNGKYLGTLAASFQISEIVERYLKIANKNRAGFVILDRSNAPMIASNGKLLKPENKFIEDLASLENKNEEIISGFSSFQKYSYIILTNVDREGHKIIVAHRNSAIMLKLLFFLSPQILEFILIALVFVFLLKKNNSENKL